MAWDLGIYLNLLSVDDVALVQGLEGEDNLRSVEFGSVIVANCYCSYVSLSLSESKPNNSPPGQYSRIK